MIKEGLSSIVNFYNIFLQSLPPYLQLGITLFSIVVVFFIFAVFVWKFHRFISTKNIIELNLNQYNTSQHPAIAKFFGSVFYFIEYIVILPFIIFFWFTVFTLFLLILASNQNTEILNILKAATIVISVVRVTAYYNENLSKEIAKLFPLTLMAIVVTDPNSLSSGVIEHLVQIPLFIENIIYFLGFIILLEIVLRFFSFLFSLFGIED